MAFVKNQVGLLVIASKGALRIIPCYEIAMPMNHHEVRDFGSYNQLWSQSTVKLGHTTRLRPSDVMTDIVAAEHESKSELNLGQVMLNQAKQTLREKVYSWSEGCLSIGLSDCFKRCKRLSLSTRSTRGASADIVSKLYQALPLYIPLGSQSHARSRVCRSNQGHIITNLKEVQSVR